MEFSFNIGYLTQMIQNITTPLLILALGIVLFFLIAYIIHDKNYTNVIKHFSDKFPLVSPEFMSKSAKEQNIENNQEIHEINKRLDKMQFYLDRLNVHQSMTLDEVKK